MIESAVRHFEPTKFALPGYFEQLFDIGIPELSQFASYCERFAPAIAKSVSDRRNKLHFQDPEVALAFDVDGVIVRKEDTRIAWLRYVNVLSGYIRMHNRFPTGDELAQIQDEIDPAGEFAVLRSFIPTFVIDPDNTKAQQFFEDMPYYENPVDWYALLHSGNPQYKTLRKIIANNDQLRGDPHLTAYYNMLSESDWMYTEYPVHKHDMARYHQTKPKAQCAALCYVTGTPAHYASQVHQNLVKRGCPDLPVIARPADIDHASIDDYKLAVSAVMATLMPQSVVALVDDHVGPVNRLNHIHQLVESAQLPPDHQVNRIVNRVHAIHLNVDEQGKDIYTWQTLPDKMHEISCQSKL